MIFKDFTKFLNSVKKDAENFETLSVLSNIDKSIQTPLDWMKYGSLKFDGQVLMHFSTDKNNLLNFENKKT